MQLIQLLGSSLGIALMSGINLYATVLTIGLGVKFGFITLPAHLSGLGILAKPEIIIIAAVLYLIEFFLDKIPWLDSVWDSFHTVIRPVGAAVLAATAFSQVDPALQLIVILLSGGVALSSHSAKAGTRLVANQSPEPFSNIFLSVIEDFVAIGGSIFVLNHPTASLAIVGVAVLLIAILSPRLYRMLNFEFLAVGAFFEDLFHPEHNAKIPLIERVDKKFLAVLADNPILSDFDFIISCFSGRGIKGGRNRPGYLCLRGNELFFVSKKFIGIRKREISPLQFDDIIFQTKFLYCRIIMKSESKRIIVNFLNSRKAVCDKAAGLIRIKTVSKPFSTLKQNSLPDN